MYTYFDLYSVFCRLCWCSPYLFVIKSSPIFRSRSNSIRYFLKLLFSVRPFVSKFCASQFFGKLQGGPYHVEKRWHLVVMMDPEFNMCHLQKSWTELCKFSIHLNTSNLGSIRASLKYVKCPKKDSVIKVSLESDLLFSDD